MSKPGRPEPEKAEVIEELLDTVDTTLDRVKVLYEQYFLGIQKQPPAYLHTEVERRLRELAQRQIGNTALRYRFATLQQKFGAYHGYWRRTLRQIEHGTYPRSLFKIGRQAVKTGAKVPEEILAAMPERMREQIVRDREAALALAQVRDHQRHGREHPGRAGGNAEVRDLGAGDLDPAATVAASTDVRPSAGGAHRSDQSEVNPDGDAVFASVIRDPALPGAAEIPRRARRRSTDSMRAATPRAKIGGEGSPEAAPSARITGRPGTTTVRGSTGAGPDHGAQFRAEIRATEIRATEIRASSSGMTAPEAASGAGRPASGAPPQGRQARPPPIPPRVPPRVPAATSGDRPSGPVPPAASPVPSRPAPPRPPTPPSQATRPLRVAPGAAAAQPPVPDETLTGPFARTPSSPPPGPSPTPSPAASPSSADHPQQVLPPGMNDADLDTLYAKYLEAKQLLGEEPEPGTYDKLLRTIHIQAPKIMAQYNSRGVDFSVVVKDNQVILRAKPKP